MIEINDTPAGIIRITGGLDIHGALLLRDAFLERLNRQAEVTADLSEVEECDASGLQILLAAQRTARRTGKQLRLEKAAKPVVAAAGALGLSLEELLGATKAPASEEDKRAD